MSLDQLNVTGKRVIVRVDFNVPLNDILEVTDDTRIRGVLPTLKKLIEQKAKLIIISHLGRPKGKSEEKFSLRPVLGLLANHLGQEITFVDDCVGEKVQQKVEQLQDGEVLLLENLRFYKEETEGDSDFAQKLAELADVYVNDAFGTAHRAHASTAVIADYFDAKNKSFGYLMQKEIENANKVLKEAEKPFIAIVGGAKVSDKIKIIEKLLQKANHIIIGGGMAYTFIKSQGGKVANSLVEDDKLELAKGLLSKAKQIGVEIHLPIDSVVANQFANDANTQVEYSNDITEGYMGLDIGPKARAAFDQILQQAKTILWNGPMGVFEMETFQAGTKSIAESVAKATQQGAFSLIGGGDSVAAINKFDLADQVSYVSTGGGAMLEYFEGKTLPGIEAIAGKVEV